MGMSHSTPRTESARQQYDRDVFENTKGFCVTDPVHADFARRLERELAEANARLQNIPALLENSAKLRRELAEAKKDSARLDWLLSSKKVAIRDHVTSKIAFVLEEGREVIDAAMEADK